MRSIRKPISKEFIDRLTQCNLYEFIARYPGLRGVTQSGDSLRALCPSPGHDDKKASNFSVSKSKNRYKCFRCGITGSNAIKFVMHAEGLEFYEAVERTADLMGMKVEYQHLSMKNQQVYNQKELLSRVHQTAESAPDLGIAITLSDSSLNQFSSAEKATLIKMGLCESRDDRDYFTSRQRPLMPIRDKRGDIVSFSVIENNEIKEPFDTGLIQDAHFIQSVIDPSPFKEHFIEPTDLVCCVSTSNALQLIKKGMNVLSSANQEALVDLDAINTLLDKNKTLVMVIPDLITDVPETKAYLLALQKGLVDRPGGSNAINANTSKVVPEVNIIFQSKANDFGDAMTLLENSQGLHHFLEERFGINTPTLSEPLQVKMESNNNLFKDEAGIKLLGALLAQPSTDHLSEVMQTLDEASNISLPKQINMAFDTVKEFIALGVTQADSLKNILPPEIKKALDSHLPPQSFSEAVAYFKQTYSASNQELLDIQARASRFYQSYLQEGKTGSVGQQYCQERGINEESLHQFKIGFAPDTHVIAKKVELELNSERSALDSGIVGRSKDGSRLYDMMRNRLIFPIENEHGQMVAFGGRAVEANQIPKYLNTKSSRIYDKSEILYGLCQVLKGDRRPNQLDFVEGYIDVLSTHQAGFKTTVATCGTAVTEKHLAKAFSYTNRINFILDGDTAGLKAAFITANRVLPFLSDNRHVSFTFLKNGEDPDSYIKSHGKAAFSALLKGSASVFKVLDRQLTKYLDLNQADHRIEYLKRVEQMLASVSPDYRKNFVNQIAGHHSSDIKTMLSRVVAVDSKIAPSVQREVS